MANRVGAFGNVCDACLTKALRDSPRPAVNEPEQTEPPLSLYEHCRRESGLSGKALDNYVNRHYGHN